LPEKRRPVLIVARPTHREALEMQPNRVTRTFRHFRRLIDTIGTLWMVLGWFGLSAPAFSLAMAVGGAFWAITTGIPAPIALMAGFCTVAAGACVGLVPLAYKTLQRVRDLPIKSQPNPEIWRYRTTFQLYEAACFARRY